MNFSLTTSKLMPTPNPAVDWRLFFALFLSGVSGGRELAVIVLFPGVFGVLDTSKVPSSYFKCIKLSRYSIVKDVVLRKMVCEKLIKY